jgi:hypothetical protein
MRSAKIKPTEIESAIECYVHGRLNEDEIEDLWIELIQNSEYLDYLKTYAALSSLRRRERLNQTGDIFLQ